MISKKVTVNNPSGLHLRPAGLFCDKAVKFQSHISFKYHENFEANAKSVLSVLGACIRNGDEIEICCDGEDEEEALKALVELVEGGFGEKA
ncbi:MAG: HPr family phosphocarrier protein [Lachnospiraceae bacterium]|nr:HPr family phosphocarrier protein [Lachnospiraceae bacterium]